MAIRAYIGAGLGFVLGVLIAQWFVRGAPPSTVLDTMQLVSAFVGGLGGFLAGSASKAGNQGRALVAAGVGVSGCLLVGLAILIYRWLFL
jgi:hypothetical protein